MLANTKLPVTHSVYRANLKKKISISQKHIRENINAADAKIIHRIQAINSKRPYQTIEEEQVVRQYDGGTDKSLETNLANITPKIFTHPRSKTPQKYPA